jgi:hypothetical protein
LSSERSSPKQAAYDCSTVFKISKRQCSFPHHTRPYAKGHRSGLKHYRGVFE